MVHPIQATVEYFYRVELMELTLPKLFFSIKKKVHPSFSYTPYDAEDEVLPISPETPPGDSFCSQVLERRELKGGRFLYRLKPDSDGTFAVSIIGGIDQGKTTIFIPR